MGHSRMMRFSVPSLASLLILASCVAPPREFSAPAPAPTPVPAPAPPPVPQPKEWRDWALTPGVWRYVSEGASSTAIFGVAGAPPLLTVRCEMPARRVVFEAVAARTGGQMIVRTTFGAASWPLQPSSASSAQFVAVRAPGDATLDQIAFSRGRFLIEVPGAAPLVLPTWAEITRVVEDCRG